MNIKDALFGIGGIALIVGLLIVSIVTAGVFIFGAAWASSTLLPWFTVLAVLAFGLTVFVILPLAIPKATRGFSCNALLVASYVFGTTLWMEGLLVTLAAWGFMAVFAGLFMWGIGVVPIAIVASLVKGMWGTVVELVMLVILTFASRLGALQLAQTLED